VTLALSALLAALPCLYWTQPAETAPTLRSAGVARLCVPAAQAEAWQAAGVPVEALDEAALKGRTRIRALGLRPRADRASATRSPWVYAHGWEFRRAPAARWVYELRAGQAALAAAEAFAYGVDALLVIDPADVADLGRMHAFLAGLPASDLPEVADFGVVDDGTDEVGEVLNLLSRRNLLYQAVPAGSKQFPLVVQLGTPEYPTDAASEPSDFALKVRRQLTDARRSLRLFGSEAVIARLAGDGSRARLHLLNYGGRDIEGLRVRLRGRYPAATARVAGHGAVEPTDRVVADGATEFTLPRVTAYAVVDLTASPAR
jgi:hypothetical protein